MTQSVIDTPIGPLLLVGGEDGLHEIRFHASETDAGSTESSGQTGSPSSNGGGAEIIAEAARQLRAYFAGTLREFDLPLAPAGTEFQLAVWQALSDIPYGRTESYGELARRIGRPKAVRAVGAANGRNPLPIVLPCHRVIGGDGSLTGYGGGLPIKQALLELEGVGAERRLPMG